MQNIVEYNCKNLKNGNISIHVDQIMTEVAKKLSIDEDDILFYNIRLAIWEIFCNIVIHAHTNMEKRVQVKIDYDDHKIIMKIIDYGEGFEWENKVNREMPGSLQIGGRGLLFIQQVCDNFYFDRIGRKATIEFNLNK